jgi:hypothetical protein
MRAKDTSVKFSLHPMLTEFLMQVDLLYRHWGDELIVTSGSEDTAKHSYASLHYATPAQAADVRIWERAQVPESNAQWESIRELATDFLKSQELPADWIDVVLESTHIHIEYQPKRKDNI